MTASAPLWLTVMALAQDPGADQATAPPAPEEQSPPPSAAPPPPAPSARVKTDRVRRAQRAVAEVTQPAPAPAPPPPVATATALSPPAPAPAAPAPTVKPPLWDRLLRSGPLHYAVYYAPDYASVAVMGGLGLGMLVVPPPVSRKAAFGPSYDLENRDTSEINDPAYNRLLGSPYRPDTVPSLLPAAVGNAAILATGLATLVRGRSFRTVHHFILGAAQAQTSSLMLTEILKSSMGRLRPDFRDRLARASCDPGAAEPPPAGVDCAGARARDDGSGHYWLNAKELQDGRRSFPSGHTSSAFAAAVYLSLFLGGEYVWGDTATPGTRVAAVAGQVAAITGAAFVAGTRLSDGRHHPEDVLVGAGLGSACAAAFYFLHFDLHGRPLVRDVAVLPALGADTFGLTVRGLF